MRVSDLAIAEDGNLVAWVAGSERYATKVAMDEDGLSDSICTCPYYIDCKHGVAAVIRLSGNPTAQFVTAYVADSPPTLGKIKGSPKWVPTK